METISTYLIAGSLIAAVLFIVGAVLLWFLGLGMAVWWAIKYVADVIRGRDEDIG
jgi:uncharacterized membrane protein